MTAWLWVSKFAKASIPQFCWTWPLTSGRIFTLQAELLMLMVGHPSSTWSLSLMLGIHDKSWQSVRLQAKGAVDFTVQKLTSGRERTESQAQAVYCWWIVWRYEWLPQDLFQKSFCCLTIIGCAIHWSEGNEVKPPKLLFNTEFFQCLQQGACVMYKRAPTHSNSWDFGWS